MRILIFLIIFFSTPYVFAQSQVSEEAEEKAGAFYQNAVQLYGEARYRESIDAFGQAILLDPKSVYFCNRAVVYLEIGEIEKSQNDFASCEQSFEGNADELASINTQKIAVADGIYQATKAKNITGQILADSLYVPPEKGWSMTSWGLLSLGIGAGLIGSAITVDFLSEDLVSDFVRESEGRSGTSPSRYEELKSDLETRQILFYGLSIGGAVASALGVTLIIADLGSENEGSDLSFEMTTNSAKVKLRF